MGDSKRFRSEDGPEGLALELEVAEDTLWLQERRGSDVHWTRRGALGSQPRLTYCP